MSPQQNRPGPGDFTGKEKARQAAEQSAALGEREHELAMASVAQDRADVEGVWDPSTNQRTDIPEVEVVEPNRQRFGAPRTPRVPVLTGKETEEELANLPGPMTAAPVATIEAEWYLIFVNEDVDKMTFGMKTTQMWDPETDRFVTISVNEPDDYSFKEGRQYKVHRAMYEHLRSKDRIRSAQPTSS